MDIITKIDNYTTCTNEDTTIYELLNIATFFENNLNEENWKNKLHTVLSSLGLHIEKTNDGLIQKTLKAGTHMSQLIWYAGRAALGDTNANKKLTEIIQKQEITKEMILDYLFKLDTVSLHMITGPIHMIEALTGWHLWANIKSKVEPTIKKVENAIKNIQELMANVSLDMKITLKQYVARLKALFGFSDAKILSKSEKHNSGI